MERFAEKTNCSYRFNGDLYVKGDCNRFNEAMDRLAGYEETGLEPSQIAEMVNKYRLLLEMYDKQQKEVETLREITKELVKK